MCGLVFLELRGSNLFNCTSCIDPTKFSCVTRHLYERVETGRRHSWGRFVGPTMRVSEHPIWVKEFTPKYRSLMDKLRYPISWHNKQTVLCWDDGYSAWMSDVSLLLPWLCSSMHPVQVFFQPSSFESYLVSLSNNDKWTRALIYITLESVERMYSACILRHWDPPPTGAPQQ